MTSKMTICTVICMAAMIFMPRQAIAQNDGGVGIGPDTPDSSAILDASSTTKGFLPPRMTEAQRDDIDNPAEGLMISCTDCEVAGLHQYINGTWQALAQSQSNNTGDYGTVVNPATGKVWLDRNLGATQVATSSTDTDSYGDLYQWGRGTDGHQERTSSTTDFQATTWLSGGTEANNWKGKFITTHTDWLDTDETHMWSGTAAENNPCPSGFRVPTTAEWEQERLSWSSNDDEGAFGSPLKLPMAGKRRSDNGTTTDAGFAGVYWSSTVRDITSRSIVFTGSTANMASTNHRANGYSIRCIQD